MGVARTMAVDVGDRRIGLAITDGLGLTAQPLFTVHRERGKSGLRMDVKAVSRFIRQHAVKIVVVGHPVHADGRMSEQAEKAEAFAVALKEANPGVEFLLLDERLTTKEAHARLDAAGSRRSDREGRLERQEIIDQMAAVVLLEVFLSQRDGVVLLPEE
jgi:putative Holliday junction resolvase